MQTPLFVRPLTADEQATLETGLRSSSALPYAAARGSSPVPRARRDRDKHDLMLYHDCPQRYACVALPRPGCAMGPLIAPTHHGDLFAAGACESLRALLPQSPRTFGKPPSRWTLALAAEVSCAQGLTPRLVSDETMRLALRRLRVTWKRAKPWSTGPDPAYARQKNGATSSSSGR